MQRYYMNIVDTGEVHKDPEGSSHSNDAEAIREATAAAREMVAEHVRFGLEVGIQRINVVDQAGRPVATVRLRDQIKLGPDASEPETNPLT